MGLRDESMEERPEAGRLKIDDLQVQNDRAYLGGKMAGRDWAKEKADLVGWQGIQAFAELMPSLSAEEVDELIGGTTNENSNAFLVGFLEGVRQAAETAQAGEANA